MAPTSRTNQEVLHSSGFRVQLKHSPGRRATQLLPRGQGCAVLEWRRDEGRNEKQGLCRAVVILAPTREVWGLTSRVRELRSSKPRDSLFETLSSVARAALRGYVAKVDIPGPASIS